MKLNLGCGHFLLDGYLNVDMFPPADVVARFSELEFPVNTFRQVRMDHFLEHQPIADAPMVLNTAFDWLLPGGKIVVEVPDMGKIVPNQPDWEQAIYGAQQHEGEFHRNGFTLESLIRHLGQSGFSEIEVTVFESEHPARPGMPCLLAVGQKPWGDLE